MSQSPYNMNPDPWLTPHTPGPWHYHNGAVYMRPFPDTSGCIAIMDREEPETATWERVANARLIAAAPELLEEAKRNLEWMDSIQKHSQFLTSAATDTRAILQKRIDTTRAAIAKAERSANA